MPYSAIELPIYQPAMRIIESITNASPASVTTTFAHLYSSGLVVRLLFPPGFGMQQTNQKTGTITVTGDTTFTIDIDTLFDDPFVVPVTYPESYQYAQVVPIAEINSLLRNAVQNVLPYNAS